MKARITKCQEYCTKSENQMRLILCFATWSKQHHSIYTAYPSKIIRAIGNLGTKSYALPLKGQICLAMKPRLELLE